MIQITNSGAVASSFLELTKHQARVEAEIAKMAVELAERARAAGVVVEIHSVPLTPLAMGNNVDIVTVFTTRGRPDQQAMAA